MAILVWLLLLGKIFPWDLYTPYICLILWNLTEVPAHETQEWMQFIAFNYFSSHNLKIYIMLLFLCDGFKSELVCVYISVSVCLLVAQSCLTLYDPVYCSPPGSSLHGFVQAKTLELVAIPFSSESSWPRCQTWVSCTSRQIIYHLSHYVGSPPYELHITNLRWDVHL